MRCRTTMSVSVRAAGLCALLFFGSAVVVAEDESPDMELLEYLGMWEGSDDEWLLFADRAGTETEKRSGAVPDGKAPPEKQDER